MSCGIGCSCSSDPMWLWLWHRWAAVALIRLLAWELPCAAGAALEKTKRKKKENLAVAGSDDCSELPWKRLTSRLDLPDAHVHHHGPLSDVRFHECCKVATVHLLDVFQVWLTVIWDHLGTLLMNIQTTI